MTTPAFIAPTLTDGSNLVPFALVQQFKDPTNTFRARNITDMYRIVPRPTAFYEYDIGAPPRILPVIYSVQNRTVSHPLEIRLTLPSYLRVIVADVGPIAAPPENPFVFRIAARGLPTKFPRGEILTIDRIAERFRTLVAEEFSKSELDFRNTTLTPSDPETGLVNLLVVFDEGQALTLDPNRYTERIVFDVFPTRVSGPVFVSLEATTPEDLNRTATIELLAEDVAEEADRIVEVPVVVETQTFVPDLVPRWIDGTDGLLKSGSAPTGWTAEADGRYYPPIVPSALGIEAERITGVLGLILTGAETASFTPLETLVNEVSSAAPIFIGATRRGFLVDVSEFFQGIQPQRIARESIDMLVADIGIENQFQILNWPDTFVNGQSVPSPILDARTREFFEFVNEGVEQVRTDDIPFTMATARQWTVSSTAKKILDTNERFNVSANLSQDDIQILRSVGTVCAIVRDIRRNGVGIPVRSR